MSAINQALPEGIMLTMIEEAGKPLKLSMRFESRDGAWNEKEYALTPETAEALFSEGVSAFVEAYAGAALIARCRAAFLGAWKRSATVVLGVLG